MTLLDRCLRNMVKKSRYMARCKHNGCTMGCGITIKDLIQDKIYNFIFDILLKYYRYQNDRKIKKILGKING